MTPVRHLSVITRLSLLLTLLAAAIMLILMMALDDSLKRFQRESSTTNEAYLSRVIQDHLERDSRLLMQALGDGLNVEIYNRDLSAIQEAFERLNETRNLEYFFIYDLDGRVVHDGKPSVPGYGNAVEKYLPTSPLAPDTLWDGDTLHLRTQIRMADQTLATMATGFDFSTAIKAARDQTELLENDENTLFHEMRQAFLITFIILLPICMFCARWLTRRYLSPLKVLTERSTRYAQGDRDINFELGGHDEFARLGSALERMRQNLEESHDQVQQMAFEDALTQLPNRHWFQKKLHDIMHRSAGLSSRFAVLFVDLDHFKEVNDTAGHERGDQLLREVGRRLTNALKSCHQHKRTPAPELARLGGGMNSWY
ncbi:MAG: hypothetical protein CMI01_09230 [Oceanospirillaceae bacterium]|nr:hypothetical protein [Oceanospirillaceae bacterium]